MCIQPLKSIYHQRKRRRRRRQLERQRQEAKQQQTEKNSAMSGSTSTGSNAPKDPPKNPPKDPPKDSPNELLQEITSDVGSRNISIRFTPEPLTTGTSALDDSFWIGVEKNDVLLGQDKRLQDHSGNRNLKDVVHSQQLLYESADLIERNAIEQDIVATVRNRGGRFLCMDHRTGEWKDVGYKVACIKVSRIFSEAYRSLKKSGIAATADSQTDDDNSSLPSLSSFRTDESCVGFATISSRVCSSTAEQSDDSSLLKSKAPPAKRSTTTSTTSNPDFTPEDVFLPWKRYLLHSGNIKLMALIDSHVLQPLKHGPIQSKKDIAPKIVETVQNYGGRFFQQDNQTREWKVAPGISAQAKVYFALCDRDEYLQQGGNIIPTVCKFETSENNDQRHQERPIDPLTYPKKHAKCIKHDPSMRTNTSSLIPKTTTLELPAKPIPRNTVPSLLAAKQDDVIFPLEQYHHRSANKKILAMIDSHKKQYISLCRKEKKDLEDCVVQTIRRMGGRFLIADDNGNTGLLKEVDDFYARSRVGLAFRESDPIFLSRQRISDIHSKPNSVSCQPKNDDLTSSTVTPGARKPVPKPNKDSAVSQLTDDRSNVPKIQGKMPKEEQGRQFATRAQEPATKSVGNKLRATHFVQKVMEIVDMLNVAPCNSFIQDFAEDDMVYLAERLLNTQDSFAKESHTRLILGITTRMERRWLESKRMVSLQRIQ